MTAAFGASLHVSGTDAALLERSIEPLRADPRLRWAKARPSLEDVFIHTLWRAPEWPRHEPCPPVLASLPRGAPSRNSSRCGATA